MKKILFVIMIMMLATFVSGQQCTETDGGLDYENKGSTKYAITSTEDAWILSKHTEVTIEEGVWLKEYYCDNDVRKSDSVDCTIEGYEKCEAGACTGKEAVAAKKAATQATQPKCGNKVLDDNEDCDPPGKICYGNGGYGQCDQNCKCPIEITYNGVVNATAENVTAENVTAAT